MKRLALIASIMLAAPPAPAQTDDPPAPAVDDVQPTSARDASHGGGDGGPSGPFDSSEVDLDAFRWVARPIVVFADTPAEPSFRRQMALLAARSAPLIERDVVVIVDTDPDAGSALRRKLRPRGFMMVLIGKDGDVKLRKPFPWDVREITRVIDKMPMRRQEIQERRDSER